MTNFFHIPLSINFSSLPILEQESGDIEKSIDSILDLIVFTPKGTFIADPDFGFEYWNHEFSNINVREFNNNYLGMVSNVKTLNEISRKQCENSLRESIICYEPRLHQPDVKVELNINKKSRKSMPSKYEMRILITGFLDDGLGIMRPYEKRISFMVEPIAKKLVY